LKFAAVILLTYSKNYIPQAMNFNNIRIVMINTSHPGNIGAAARVMKNMGMERLYLVEPKSFPDAQATAMASGADDLLSNAMVCQSLEEAVQGCRLVMGTTARERKIQQDFIDARVAGELIRVESDHHEVALLFGRERTGLTNDEIGLCQKLINISTNPAYPSLNVASAIQIVCYEIMMAAVTPDKLPEASSKAIDYAASDEMERFYQHLEQTLFDIEFLRPRHSPQLMPKLRNMYNRLRLEQQELNILRGILSKTQRVVKK
jgi:tRNA (cytidine32/uridine32-2'-O)-methyltransferase